MAENEFTATMALAMAWASMDGRIHIVESLPEGKSGYDEDAAEMIRRLERRGYSIVPAGTIAALEARVIALDRLLAEREGVQRARENPPPGYVAASTFSDAAAGWEAEKRAHEITTRQRDQWKRELDHERKLRREALAGWDADKKHHANALSELSKLRGNVLAYATTIKIAADDLGRAAT